MRYPVLAAAAMLIAGAGTANAQQGHSTMDHSAHAASSSARGQPTSPGQSAYGAIAEIVRLLESDSSTDWSKVNLEALRQHLVDMDEVTLRAQVEQRAVPGGSSMNVTGTGRTVDAIRRMTTAHARTLASLGMSAATAEIPNGVRLTVTAKDPRDQTLIAKIRGLGFIGVMTLGDYHGAHHLAIARGAHMAGHDGH